MASRRQYLAQAELAEFADISITDATEADDQISMAEELIDAYVGFQKKFFPREIFGLNALAGSSSIKLQSDQQNIYDIDYFKLCEVELIGGTGSGQRSVVTTSTKAGVLTVASSWDTTPDITTYYKIYQLGKFPRFQDVHFDSQNTPSTYFKSIPEAVKRAVAAQVEYRIYMGESYFQTDKPDLKSESIGDYSYSKGGGSKPIDSLIAPKAKELLRGIRNRTGVIIR